MTTADNSSPSGESGTPAGDAELTVPKHRLDEVLAKVRRLEEENAIKDRLYTEDRQRMQAAQPRAVEPEMTAEEFGLDPSTFKAFHAVAERIAAKKVREKEAVFSSQIGMLAGRTEKAELLASKGADKAKYIPEIERRQQDHFNRTGTFLPAEIALDLIQSHEKDERIKRLEAQLAGKPAEGNLNQDPHASSAVMPQGLPNAAGTRQMPTSGGTNAAPGTKTFSQLSVEEMEARLDAAISSGAGTL